MAPPADQVKLYHALYNDFTVAYINAHVVRREFYPQAKKLAARIEPEINRYLAKIEEASNAQESAGYKQIVRYTNLFDDFTLIANRLFSDLQITLDKSDAYMNRLMDIKTGPNKPPDDPEEVYVVLIPELTQLVNSLKHITERATLVENKMRALETDWENTKAKLE